MKRLLSLALLALLSTGITATAAETPKASGSAGGTLRLNTKLSHPYLSVNSTQDVYATVSVKGGESVASKDRAPLNIALVIDRSTSMSDGKLAQAKIAARHLIDTLAPTDRLAIVSYGSDVTTEMKSTLATPANKELLYNAVLGVELSGSTFLSGGYQRGVDLVLPHLSQKTINRVMLISDGRANHGIVNPARLANLVGANLERGVSLTTMGIGLDYNEDLMTGIAQAGAGNYYFIENTAALAQIFESEATGLSSTVARNTVVTLEVAPGVELLEIEGFAYKLKGNKATIRLSEFYAHQEKDLLARMSVTTNAAGNVPIITAKLRFEDVALNKKRSSSVKLSAVATADTNLAKKNVDTKVMKRVQQVRVAQSMNDAMVAWEKGNQAKAEKILKAQRAEITTNAAAYDFEDDASFGAAQEQMKEMEKTVKKHKASSRSGKRSRKASKKRSYDISNSAALF